MMHTVEGLPFIPAHAARPTLRKAQGAMTHLASRRSYVPVTDTAFGRILTPYVGEERGDVLAGWAIAPPEFWRYRASAQESPC